MEGEAPQDDHGVRSPAVVQESARRVAVHDRLYRNLRFMTSVKERERERANERETSVLKLESRRRRRNCIHVANLCSRFRCQYDPRHVTRRVISFF